MKEILLIICTSMAFTVLVCVILAGGFWFYEYTVIDKSEAANETNT